jgi:chromosome segregation ATPase
MLRSLSFTAVLAAATDLGFDRFAGEVARINNERDQERVTKENMAKAIKEKGMALANELNARGERRRMLQLREQDLFAQWTATQRKLELQAKGMMEELGESASFVSNTRKSLDAAKSERSAQLARAEQLDQQRRSLMDKRRDLLQTRAIIAASLEELSGNMTVLDAAKQKAMQAAVQQADAVAQEEAQLASLEHDSSKERSELWNLDVRLHTLQGSLNQTLARAEGLEGTGGPQLPVLEPSPVPAPSSRATAPQATPLPEAGVLGQLVRGFAPSAS